jgi:type I protein arginine methyltransferase
MPPKSATRRVPTGPVIRSESLLATETEKHATSKSLYGDHKARISSNVSAIHDRVRIKAFQSILNSLKGKNVLHLGCGVGILSMMAARAMAKHVVAVDSSAIVEAVTIVAQQNSLDNITFLRGSIKELTLPVEKFDVVICEWMGAFLTNEKTVEDLIYCRDHLLSEGGVICPDRSSMHVVGITDYNYYFDSVEYWENVYGFNMTPMKKLVLEEASACHIPKHCIVTNSCLVHSVNIRELDMNQRGYTAPYTIQASKKATLHFLTFYIDCTFNNPVDPGANFVIGFNPGRHNTWTEVSVMLTEAIPVNAGDVVKGTVSVEVTEKATYITVSADCDSAAGKTSTSGKYIYSF